MDKIREIAVLKLIGTRNRTIAAMILQQALELGLIGFAVGTITATFAAPLFPKYVLLLPGDVIIGFFAVMTICALASVVAIRIALKVDPAEAIAQTVVALAAADTAAQVSLQSVSRQYELGAASYIQLLIAQQQAQQTQAGLAEAQAQRLADSVAVYQAMGGSTQ